MLAASVLCFYIKQYSEDQRDIIDEETSQTIQTLLRRSHDIWLRSSSVSNEAQKAVQSLGIILGIRHPSKDGEIANQLFGDSEDLFTQFDNLASWPVYEGERPVGIIRNKHFAHIFKNSTHRRLFTMLQHGLLLILLNSGQV